MQVSDAYKDIAANLQRQIDAVASNLEESKDAMFNIGDIKCSIRGSLGNDWLPCDESIIDQNLYPDLYNLIKPNSAELGGIAAKVGEIDAWTELGVCVTTAGVVLFFNNNVLYKWKDGSTVSLGITYVNPKTQNNGSISGQPYIDYNHIYRIKHLIIDDNVDYYYVKAGLTDAYILDKNGDIVSHIIVSTSSIAGIHDMSIGPDGSVAFIASPALGNSNKNLYVCYGKETIDFSLKEQTITSLNSSQPDSNLGYTYYVSMHVDNNNVYVTVYDGYSSSNYDYVKIYIIPLTSGGTSYSGSTLQKVDGNPIRREIICNLDSNRLLLKRITNSTGFDIYNISSKSFTYVNKSYISNDSYIWVTAQYIYILNGGIYKILKTDLSDTYIESMTISNNTSNLSQFAITDEGTTRFIQTTTKAIYDTGFAGTPNITLDGVNAFIKAK